MHLACINFYPLEASFQEHVLLSRSLVTLGEFSFIQNFVKLAVAWNQVQPGVFGVTWIMGVRFFGVEPGLGMDLVIGLGFDFETGFPDLGVFYT